MNIKVSVIYSFAQMDGWMDGSDARLFSGKRPIRKIRGIKNRIQSTFLANALK